MKTQMRITAFALAACMLAALAPAALAEAPASLAPAPVMEGELTPGAPEDAPSEDAPLTDVEDPAPEGTQDVVVSVEPAGDPSADDVPLEEPDEVIEDDKDLDAASVTAFVQRLYRVCMGREADASGLNTWVTGLLYGGQTGASVAHGFFDSKEYKAMNRTDYQYVNDLYSAMFDRAADQQGLATWTAFLDGGMSRDYVYAGFVNGVEFKNLCARYGISPGTYTSGQPRDQNPSVTAFVQRLYQVVFGRKGDESGLNDWTNRLIIRDKTGAQVVQGFFGSGEYTRQNKSDDQYIADLYRAMFDRAGDAGGTATWKSLMGKGVSRTYVLKGFAEGTEFKNLCARYNIIQGTIATSEARDVNPNRTGFANNLIKYLMGYTNGNTSILNNYAAYLNGGHSGSQLVNDYVLKTSEYTALAGNLSASGMATALYNGLLGRENDISGYEKQNLANIVLNSGIPAAVQTVLQGDEFKDYCKRCEVTVGGGTTDPGGTTPLPGTLTVEGGGQVRTAAATEVLAYVVMGEVGGMNNAEVFKAQAVAAYSWIMYQYSAGTTAPKVSWKEPTQAVRDAVNAVAGQMLTYNGKAAQTSYFASSAGRTNAAVDVWGGNVPYLVSVASAYDAAVTPSDWYSHTEIFTSDEMSKIFHSLYDGTQAAVLNADPAQWLTVIDYGPNYLAKYVQCGLTYLNDDTGNTIVNPKPKGNFFIERANKYLGGYRWRSPNFVMNYNGNGTWTFTFYGWGHGVGMSQYGAYGYATKAGWNYQQILAHYFPGTVLTTA